MLFLETNETNIKNLHSLFFVFFSLLFEDEAFFDKFLWLQKSNREREFIFLVHMKENQPKDQAAKSTVNTGKARLSKSGLHSKLPRFVSMIWLNISFHNFCFPKHKNVLQTVLRKNCPRCKLIVRIFCVIVRPWRSSQSRRSHGKTVRLGRFENLNKAMLLSVAIVY